MIRVLDPHDSGWWTGEYKGRTGFFPVNRTETQLLDVAAYQAAQKKLLVKPMFTEAAAPALPTADVPLIKAAKLLGVTPSEAEVLSPHRNVHNSGVRTPTSGESSPRKALAVMGFDDDDVQPADRKRNGSGSMLSKLSLKVSGGLRRFTQAGQSEKIPAAGGGADLGGSGGVPEAANTTTTTASTRVTRSPTITSLGSPKRSTEVPEMVARKSLGADEMPQRSGREAIASSKDTLPQASGVRRRSLGAEDCFSPREDAAARVGSPRSKPMFDDDDDNVEVNESNLLY